MRKLSFNKIVLAGLVGLCFAANVSAAPPYSTDSVLGPSPFPGTCTVGGSSVLLCEGVDGAGAVQASESSIVQRIHPSLLKGFNCQIGTQITEAPYFHYMISFMAESFSALYKDPFGGQDLLNPMAEGFFCGRDRYLRLPPGTSQAEQFSAQSRIELSYFARGFISVAVDNYPNCVMSNPFEWFQYAFANANNSVSSLAWGGPVVFGIAKAVVDMNDPDSCCAKAGSLSDRTREFICPVQ